MTAIRVGGRRPVARVRRRRALAWAVAGTAIVAGGALTIAVGDIGADAVTSARALFGIGEPGLVLIVQEWRLPRAILAVVVGALLGLSGALFQIITRNPLGSPDILGFSAGSFTGVILAMAAGLSSVLALTAAAVGGGLATALLVFALSARSGVRGFALIVTGIGVAAFLSAVNLLLVLRTDDAVGHAAAIWALGSLNGVDLGWVLPGAAALLVCGAAVAALSPSLVLYELGEERAATLGARPGATRLRAMVLGVAMLAVATAITGPIAFIALAAPQIARRVWRTGTIPLGATAATGAVLLSVSDLAAARLFSPTILPTGMITVCVGGAYLAWMLWRDRRRTG